MYIVESEDDFNAQLESAGDKLVVVDFFATWCGPCKMIAPYFEELSKEFTDVVFLKVDVQEVEELSSVYNVQSIPKFVLIKNKKEIADMLGADREKLKALIEENK